MYYVFRWYYRYHHHYHHTRYYPRSTPLPLLHMANATAITTTTITITTTIGTAALGAPTSVMCSTTNQVPAPAPSWRAEHRVPGVLTREASDVSDTTTAFLTNALRYRRTPWHWEHRRDVPLRIATIPARAVYRKLSESVERIECLIP